MSHRSKVSQLVSVYNGLQCVCKGALTPFSRVWITILLVLLQQLPHKEGILSVGETPDEVKMN